MKSMAFIDYQNFNIGLKNYFDEIGQKPFNVNYLKLTDNINSKILLTPHLVKTYLFAYKPCEELMKLDSYAKYYKWLSSIRNKPYFEVIEGLQEIRPIEKGLDIDINNAKTYITKEKETDICLATTMISKAYLNAYDVAILISGDTDYIPVVRELHNLGKVVVLATLPQQNTLKYDKYKDENILIDIDLLEKSI